MKTHGMGHTKFNYVWTALRKRCDNPKHQAYKNYGGRGITYDPRREKFENFKDDMYESYLEHKKTNSSTSIERKNNDGNYCKENCIWITKGENNKNKRNVHIIEGVPVAQYCKDNGLSYDMVMKRINTYKRSIEDAISKPKQSIPFRK